MKVQIRIATDSFSYIEAEIDGTAKDVADTYRELKEALGDLIPETKPNAETPFPTKGDLGNCADCGAPRAMSKLGKPYCSARCWLKK